MWLDRFVFMVNFGCFSEEVSLDMWLEYLDAWLESFCQFVRGENLHWSSLGKYVNGS